MKCFNGRGGLYLMDKPNMLINIINIKKNELKNLTCIKNSLLDEEVYKKSCELDKLVVKYMRKCG
jgi:hypothetical protein